MSDAAAGEGVTVIISEYDARWPSQYAAEAGRLAAGLVTAGIAPQRFSFEHVGSTAVPGLGAKPIIDLMLGLRDFDADAGRAVKACEQLGYVYHPEFEVRIPERRFLRGVAPEGFACNLHIVPIDGVFWLEHLKFRDVLRIDARLAAEYDVLKRGLAMQSWPSTSDYSDAKTEFIEQVLRSQSSR